MVIFKKINNAYLINFRSGEQGSNEIAKVMNPPSHLRQ
jgi:hypothetical protein